MSQEPEVGREASGFPASPRSGDRGSPLLAKASQYIAGTADQEGSGDFLPRLERQQQQRSLFSGPGLGSGLAWGRRREGYSIFLSVFKPTHTTLLKHMNNLNCAL